jgi:hypothetical protein
MLDGQYQLILAAGKSTKAITINLSTAIPTE